MEDVPFKLGVDLLAPDGCFLTTSGGVVLEAEAERWPICVGEVVIVIESLLRKEPGRPPNLGKWNWMSLPFP